MRKLLLSRHLGFAIGLCFSVPHGVAIEFPRSVEVTSSQQKVAPIVLQENETPHDVLLRIACSSNFAPSKPLTQIQTAHLREVAARVNAARKDYYAKVETLLSEWRQATGGGTVPPELVEKQKRLGKELNSFDIPGEIILTLDPEQARDLVRTYICEFMIPSYGFEWIRHLQSNALERQSMIVRLVPSLKVSNPVENLVNSEDEIIHDVKESFYRQHRKLLRETIDLAIDQDESLRTKARKLIDSIPDFDSFRFSTNGGQLLAWNRKPIASRWVCPIRMTRRLSPVGDLSRLWGIFLRDHQVTSNIESMPAQKVASLQVKFLDTLDSNGRDAVTSESLLFMVKDSGMLEAIRHPFVQEVWQLRDAEVDTLLSKLAACSEIYEDELEGLVYQSMIECERAMTRRANTRTIIETLEIRDSIIVNNILR